MQKWEYTTSIVFTHLISRTPLEQENARITEHLNEMGSHGWELVSAVSREGTLEHRLYFKRPIT
jgi:hypothetical protein